jgi:hypothetical protein
MVPAPLQRDRFPRCDSGRLSSGTAHRGLSAGVRTTTWRGPTPPAFSPERSNRRVRRQLSDLARREARAASGEQQAPTVSANDCIQDRGAPAPSAPPCRCPRPTPVRARPCAVRILQLPRTGDHTRPRARPSPGSAPVPAIRSAPVPAIRLCRRRIEFGPARRASTPPSGRPLGRASRSEALSTGTVASARYRRCRSARSAARAADRTTSEDPTPVLCGVGYRVPPRPARGAFSDTRAQPGSAHGRARACQRGARAARATQARSQGRQSVARRAAARPSAVPTAAKVFDMLLALPKVGRVKAAKMMR